MGLPAVAFEGVWKKFRRGERHDSLRDLIPSTFKRLTGRHRPDDLDGSGEFWAVKDVSFEIAPGQAVGIIGPNGAGKSTTLKLLTRILRPTRGAARVQGRVGALIEVAAGFHPDLTGRENIFLQGAIMGMSRADIARHLDAIIDFSGVAQFVDTPVKRYSSGMQARLGFSIAAHLEPDVLFVDEVLSVGDMSFQAKCLERMRQNVASGVTLVFVSHNLQAVASLCRRTLVFGRGEMLYDGRTDEALGIYLRASQQLSERYGTAKASFRIERVELAWDDLEEGADVPPNASGRLTVTLEGLEPASQFNIGFELERTRDLLYCYGITTQELGHGLFSSEAGERVSVSFRFQAHLSRGHYRFNLNVRQPNAAAFLFVAESVAQFSIVESRSYDGVVDLEPSMDVTIEPTNDYSQRAFTTA